MIQKLLTSTILAFILSADVSLAKTVRLDTCYTDVSISGLMVCIYSKKDIRKQKKNEALAANNKSHYLLIDERVPYVFIPIDSSKKIVEFSEINRVLTGKALNLFIGYEAIDYYGLEKFGHLCLKELEKSQSLPGCINRDLYILKKGKRRYCYRLYYFNATWSNLTMSQSETYELVTQMYKELDSSVDHYSVFILKSLNNSSDYQNFKSWGFKRWQPR